jgi:serine/threonine protein kinase
MLVNQHRGQGIDMALQRGTLLQNGRYQIQRLLARGGFGFIYLTLDRRSGRHVVLKELIPMLVSDPQVQRRFTREGRAMQRLQHPNIARVEAMFRDGGNHYMVIEYLSGGSLADRLDREGKLSLSQATAIAVALCDALSYLHQLGITHCDLNPSNVLFDAQGHPKLIDLGIAHVSEMLVHRSWRTERDFSMGTVVYMAPEQLSGVRDDPRIDQYALGAIFYQMVSGRHYLSFDMTGTPDAQADNIKCVRNEMPEPIPGLSEEINQVILCALAKARQDRYPDIAAFRQALSKALVPYLPSAQGIRLVAPFQPVGTQANVYAEVDEWPRWVWGMLCAVNLAVMLLFAWLLLGTP